MMMEADVGALNVVERGGNSATCGAAALIAEAAGELMRRQEASSLSPRTLKETVRRSWRHRWTTAGGPGRSDDAKTILEEDESAGCAGAMAGGVKDELLERELPNGVTSAADLGRIVSSSDRIELMSRLMQEEPDSIDHVLTERQKDLELAARIGQSLLEQNRSLEGRNTSLEGAIGDMQDEIKELQHKLKQKSELLTLYTANQDQVHTSGCEDEDETSDEYDNAACATDRAVAHRTTSSGALGRADDELDFVDNGQASLNLQAESAVVSATTRHTTMTTTTTTFNQSSNAAGLLYRVSRRQPSHLVDLKARVHRLEKENAMLRSRTDLMLSQSESAELREDGVVKACMSQLGQLNKQVAKLSEELAQLTSCTDQSASSSEEVSPRASLEPKGLGSRTNVTDIALFSQNTPSRSLSLVERQKRHGKLCRRGTDVDPDQFQGIVTQLLQLTDRLRQCEDEKSHLSAELLTEQTKKDILANQIDEMRRRYDDCVHMLRTVQSEAQQLRQTDAIKQRLSASFAHEVMTSQSHLPGGRFPRSCTAAAGVNVAPTLEEELRDVRLKRLLHDGSTSPSYEEKMIAEIEGDIEEADGDENGEYPADVVRQSAHTYGEFPRIDERQHKRYCLDDSDCYSLFSGGHAQPIGHHPKSTTTDSHSPDTGDEVGSTAVALRQRQTFARRKPRSQSLAPSRDKNISSTSIHSELKDEDRVGASSSVATAPLLLPPSLKTLAPRLQLVKPLDGSETLHRWQRLANAPAVFEEAGADGPLPRLSPPRRDDVKWRTALATPPLSRHGSMRRRQTTTTMSSDRPSSLQLHIEIDEADRQRKLSASEDDDDYDFNDEVNEDGQTSLEKRNDGKNDLILPLKLVAAVRQTIEIIGERTAYLIVGNGCASEVSISAPRSRKSTITKPATNGYQSGETRDEISCSTYRGLVADVSTDETATPTNDRTPTTSTFDDTFLLRIAELGRQSGVPSELPVTPNLARLKSLHSRRRTDDLMSGLKLDDAMSAATGHDDVVSNIDSTVALVASRETPGVHRLAALHHAKRSRSSHQLRSAGADGLCDIISTSSESDADDQHQVQERQRAEALSSVVGSIASLTEQLVNIKKSLFSKDSVAADVYRQYNKEVENECCFESASSW